jgi:alpha-galactosidase
MQRSFRLFTALLLAPLAALHAATPSSEEHSIAKQWALSQVFPDSAETPFSFVVGGESASKVMRDWKRMDTARDLDAQRRERTRRWTDERSGLQVRLVATEYAGHPVVEWTVWLKNTGTVDTAIIKGIQGLDMTFDRDNTGEFVLHGVRGDSCLPESFRPYALKLGPDAVKRCSPPVAGDKVSGKSSDGPDGWPYWNLQRPGGRVILAVGWPGQWEATFTRDHERGLRVRAGQQLTHLVLKPGEEIRTPSITLLFWQGEDVVRAQNLWRSWYLVTSLGATGNLVRCHPHSETIAVASSPACFMGGTNWTVPSGMNYFSPHRVTSA